MNFRAQRTSEERLHHNLTTTRLGGSANCQLPSWVALPSWALSEADFSELLISLWDIVAKQVHMAFHLFTTEFEHQIFVLSNQGLITKPSPLRAIFY
jgi:hypothetical protein